MAGLTQEQLAEKTDVTRQTVSKWESGISTPDWESMIKISKLFNFTLDEFAGSNEGYIFILGISTKIKIKKNVLVDCFGDSIVP